ncbi:M23 family metallopeptidase [Anditalea andensis]|uniref:Peptidase M23 n=1 Tax=Anditalea andensis TaxID=1048983 RepID=A0A074KUE8_9BACT|nr:M23 family metallopeptidase [Anditalea andensis]KEO72534.1 peptidase M23 [Anditalea andensis]
MSRIKYYYDPKSCKYERYTRSTWDVTISILGLISLSSIMAIAGVMIFHHYFDSPKELSLKNENKELMLYYKLLEEEVNTIDEMVADLQERDDNLYRVIFESEPIPSTVRKAGFGGNERYKNIIQKGLKKEKMILSVMEKVDQLKRKLYVQSVSYDELSETALNKEEYWASIPAIQPIHNEELNNLASGFGIRLHPILKVRKMHTGIDFSAPKGTPIYATGDGVIDLIQTEFGGYGKNIIIDHGFGFTTRYAHMNDFNVKKGQKVKRGDCIGYVGNTGSSTAPHVHYEIIKDGVHVNPVHYFFKDLDPLEYDRILELASKENQSLS